MPAPLLWLGAAALGIFASNEVIKSDMKRRGIVSNLPSHGRPLHNSLDVVQPVNGSIVCCGIYEVLDHTGIWIDGNIYELSGKGLVRSISPDRFLDNRSGENIFVACSQSGDVMSCQAAIERCRQQLYQVYDYHIIRQNCHKFVAEMVSGKNQDITSFSDLNEFLFHFFDETINWQLADVAFR